MKSDYYVIFTNEENGLRETLTTHVTSVCGTAHIYPIT